MKMKTYQFTIFCPKCDSTNIIKNGSTPNGRGRIKCKDCGRQSTLDMLPKLATLTCKNCGKLGVNSRDSMLCINCYLREKPSEYIYTGLVRQTLSTKEKVYFKKHLDELPARLNLTMKQQKYYQENPHKWDKLIGKLLR